MQQPSPPSSLRTAEDFGRALTELRKARGMTIAAVAAASGIARGTLGGFFAGTSTPNNREEVIPRILTAMGVIDPALHREWIKAAARIRLRAARPEPDPGTSAHLEVLVLAAHRLDPREPADWPGWEVVAQGARVLAAAFPGEDVPLPYAAVLGRIADQKRARGLLGEAAALYDDTLARVRGEPPDAPDVLALRHGRARVRAALGRTRQAEREMRGVLEARARVLGPDHPDTLTSLHYLGRAIRAADRTHEAHDLFLEARERRAAAFGLTDRGTLTSANNVGETLLALGRHDEARVELATTLSRRAGVLGDRHPAVLTTRQYLTELKLRTGSLDTALPDAHRLAATSAEILGRRHPRTLDALFLHGRVLLRTRDRASAEPLLAEVLMARRALLGDEHPATRRVRAALAS